jgi:hypothetical protein
MQPWFLRFYRIMQIVLGGMFLLIGGLQLAKGEPMRHVVGAWAVALFVVLVIQARFFTFGRLLAGIERGLEAIGRSDLESPQPVTRRGMEEVLDAYTSTHEAGVGTALAKTAAGNAVRLCVRGQWRGREIEIGTVVSPGRNRSSKVSYVCVRDSNVRMPFLAMTRGFATSLARAFITKHPVTTGDAAFDGKWVVDADEALARTVLDPPTRQKLLELEARVAWLRAVSVQAMPYGLVVRWPGLLSADGAALLRDLACSVHEKLAES